MRWPWSRTHDQPTPRAAAARSEADAALHRARAQQPRVAEVLRTARYLAMQADEAIERALRQL